MDRSLGFGSTDTDESPYSDSLSLRLRLITLTKPVPRNSQVHSSIGTRLALLAHWPFTVCKHTVSCSISLPFGGSFHLSLTVLCAIGHDRIFSLGGWSPQIQTGFLVPRLTYERSSQSKRFRLRDYHRLWCGFPAGFVYRLDFLLTSRCSTLERSPCNPPSRNAATLTRVGFRLFPVRSPLLRESRLMSFPPAT
jgi:hypothetical protein